MKILKLAAFLLALAALNVSAFNFTYNTNSFPKHWTFVNPDPGVPTNSFNPNTHAIRYYISSEGWSATNTAAELNAVRNCFGQWQSIPGAVIKFEEAGLFPPGYHTNNQDNTNVIYWAKTSTFNQNDLTGALGFTTSRFTTLSNIVLQFDIILNGSQFNWYTDFNDKNNPGQFIEGTLLHEIGHALGLNHAALGGATLLYHGNSGVDSQAGLSADEVAFAHALYPQGAILSTLGNVAGTVIKSGSPVFGAAVIAETSGGIVAGATVTLSNGTYVLNALPPGNYNLRVVPLDSSSASRWLIRGTDINATFAGADTGFTPTGNTPVTLTGGATNTADFTVTNGTPAFRITVIRAASSNPNAFSINTGPASLTAGQSNYTVGVFSADLPTAGATFTITGDGLTLGAPVYYPGNVFAGLNGISMSISVASNATPGLRSFIVQQNGNVAYANGYFEVLPAVIDYNFDGLDDLFQRAYFSPFTSASAAPTADPDLDGLDNYAESVAGTDPANAASLLKLTSTTTAANGTTVHWQSVSGKRYQLASRTNAVLGTWQSVGSVVTANSTNSQQLDSSATNGIRFYRVQVLP